MTGISDPFKNKSSASANALREADVVDREGVGEGMADGAAGSAAARAR